jgi:hypothetical protein
VGGACNLRGAQFRQSYPIASISTPRPYAAIFDLVSAV